jgi:Eco57I restriction-modification methylase
MQGQLFNTDYLSRGINDTAPWQAFGDNDLAAFTLRLHTLFATGHNASLNEAQTESELIEPLLAELGWGECLMPQVNLSDRGREDVPDYLLFPDPAAKALALSKPDAQRAAHGIALLEGKRYGRELDRAETTPNAANKKARDFGTPSSQMLRYLSRVDVMSDRAVKWGLLTNGAVWRLYWQDARSRAEEFFEIDLAQALQLPGTQPALPDPDALPPAHQIKLFFVLFHRAAFLQQSWDVQRRSFHAIALSEARLYEEQVSASLGQRVFNDVFPNLAMALARSDIAAQTDKHGHYTPEYLDEVRDATLILLYRLLFVFYAEDRRLLPIVDPRYTPYSLSTLRDDVAAKRDAGHVFPTVSSVAWRTLDDIFLMISQGDAQVGMPAYNGGLFERGRSAVLARCRIRDADLAPAIDALSRRTDDLLKARINYRDLSVAHLGGIYERLLEYALVQDVEPPPPPIGITLYGTGHIPVPVSTAPLVARPASFARKVSGSYYTHDDLVQLVLAKSVGVLIAECSAAHDALIARYSKKTTLKPYEWDEIDRLDPASTILALKVCDPAMGSGHFLVSLVDYVADHVLRAVQHAQDAVNAAPWAAHLVEQGRPWASPVTASVADIRRRIKAESIKGRWALDDKALDDRHIVRRMVLKKVIFGVDKNVMAVELAKVALWLHTFTVGAPLSFLDHHLQCGDSLHGEKLSTVQAGLEAMGTLFQGDELKRLEIAAHALAQVADLTDASIAEAHESKRLADEAAAQLAPVHALLDAWRALRWLVPGWPKVKKAKISRGADAINPSGPRKRSASEILEKAQRSVLGSEAEQEAQMVYLAGISELFSTHYNLSKVLMDGYVMPHDKADEHQKAANALITEIKALAKREHFFHWWSAFPNVFATGNKGGFDAVIGNPPWDRIKLQDIEWFAERSPAIAFATKAADRKALIAEQARRRTALWRAYRHAAFASEAAARVVRDTDEYPMLSGGDVNLYSLFIERAQHLAHGNGIMGLITPSGIAADKGASEFFNSISTTGRLGALYDFENKKVFFPDVHASFKFCALFFGAKQRRFAHSECAFFLHHVDEIKDPDKLLRLGADDFARVNPNTGAAPIFRSQRDAQLTTRIYAAHPVLVRRTAAVQAVAAIEADVLTDTPATPAVLAAPALELKAWPVKYTSMFHMTNDSHLFMTRAELLAGGWVQGELNRWVKVADKKSKTAAQIAVPLYEGKMVQAYDHRAADVVVNTNNLHRAAQQEPIADGDKRDPNRLPAAQYWVSFDETKANSLSWALGFKEITAPTNMRTVMAMFLPAVGFGNKVPLLLPQDLTPPQAAQQLSLLAANLNSYAFDFVSRQKIQGQTLNLFILEQLPVITPTAFEATFGKGKRKSKFADFIRAEVLALTYTAHDLATFARDMGYIDDAGQVKPPFVFNALDRAHRMARLDAVFMHLYGINLEDAAYMLNTFPIIRERDIAAHGRFMTLDLILAYMKQLAQGELGHVDVVI